MNVSSTRSTRFLLLLTLAVPSSLLSLSMSAGAMVPSKPNSVDLNQQKQPFIQTTSRRDVLKSLNEGPIASRLRLSQDGGTGKESSDKGKDSSDKGKDQSDKGSDGSHRYQFRSSNPDIPFANQLKVATQLEETRSNTLIQSNSIIL